MEPRNRPGEVPPPRVVDSNSEREPTVSVVIPTYGRAKLVRQSVMAALAQTRAADEILVSDDASLDDTVAVLEELARTHETLKIVRQPTNLGPNDNVNACIDGSSGDLIAFCADDDMFMPWHLERTVDFLRRNPRVGLVHSWFSTLASEEDGRVRVDEMQAPPRPTIVNGADAIEYLISNYSWPFHASTLVFWRSTWEKVGKFDPTFTLADTDWFLKCIAKVPVAFLPEVHVMYRRHPGNMSNAMGSVAMHRDVNGIALRFIHNCVREQDRPLLLAKWTAFNALRILRLAVARARAGHESVATDALELLVESTPLGGAVPEESIRTLGRGMTAVLSRLQKVLPGGAGKYSALGLSQPK